VSCATRLEVQNEPPGWRDDVVRLTGVALLPHRLCCLGVVLLLHRLCCLGVSLLPHGLGVALLPHRMCCLEDKFDKENTFKSDVEDTFHIANAF
jgi:hypothetical protein